LIEQILEAFSSLHEHNIAHLDIKDRNVVIDTVTERIYVIDFDLSRRVDGVGEKINGYRGTEDWVAPEVGDSPYSAIRADLWAVGQLIE
ncbi:kinase domain-containing protein, partial [Melanogaster broomeanus]